MSFASTSSFQRHVQRDDRRRRLLTDDLSCADDQEDSADERCEELPPNVGHYGDASFLDRQWRLHDLVPCRIVALLGLLAVGAATIGGLEAAYAWMSQRALAEGVRLAALDVAAKGSLACWFSSLLLLAAALMAMLVHAVRRHRTDDYQGRYRVWLWAAGGWLLLATDQAASLREAFQTTMITATGTPLWGDGSLWWLAAYALIFGAIGSRLLLDMWPARASVVALLLGAVAHALAMASRLGWPVLGDAVSTVMLQTASEMSGNLFLLCAMAAHARYVLLDAKGLLPRRKAKVPKDKDAVEARRKVSNPQPAASSDSGRWTKIDPPHRPTPQPAAQRPDAVANAPVGTPSTGSASPSGPIQRKLTKAERRAMKERLLRDRRSRDERDE
ncbi:MAG: hypothetical protein ABFC63_00625 [Thermoguttaceae bacterium]